MLYVHYRTFEQLRSFLRTDIKSLELLSLLRTKTDFSEQIILLNKLREHLRKKYNVECAVKLNTKVKSQTNSDDCGPFGKNLSSTKNKLNLVLLYAREIIEGGHYLDQIGMG